MATNFLDRVIGWVSPSAGLERIRSRYMMEMISSKSRNYEAASTGRRTDGWQPLQQSARVVTDAAISKLRGRSRDLTRNNPYAAKALSVIVNNVVGTGIVPRAVSKRGNRADAAMQAWKDWAETTKCDIDGLHDIYGLQALTMRTVVESGECLVRRVYTKKDGMAVPLQLQVLEPDFIDVSKDTLQPNDAGEMWVQGIKINRFGQRIAYMLYNAHPGDNQLLKRLESSEVPADDIIHVYRVDRPGQLRGVPWPAPVMIRMKDFDEYEDAQLMRQKVAACFSMFITDANAGELNASGKPVSIPESVEPGMIEVLPPGKTIEFAEPPGVTNYGEYATTMLRSIAAGYGVTYESLTGDLSPVNFSSGRMGWIEFHRNVEAWRWAMFIPRFCDGIWSWFSDAAELKGVRMENVTVQWTPPRREMIDPEAEIKAAVTAVRGGITSLPEVIRQNGQDPEVVLKEIAETNALLDSLGLILESDTRKTTQAGMLQIDPNVKNNGSTQ